MGQALPKHHWHQADKFLVAAQLLRQPPPPDHEREYHHPHLIHHHQKQQHDNHHGRRRLSLSTATTINTTRPSSPADSAHASAGDHDDDTAASLKPALSQSGLSSSCSASFASSYDDDAGGSVGDDASFLDSAEARALAAAAAEAHWADVVRWAREFERVYARALEAWVAAGLAQAQKTREGDGSERGRRGRSKGRRGHGRKTGSSSRAGGAVDDDGEAADGDGVSLRTSTTEGEEEGYDGDGEGTTNGDAGRPLHARPEWRADVGKWTAADLVDLATRGGPLRCYRWESGQPGDGRVHKERYKRQLADDATRFGWDGRLIVRNFQTAALPERTGAGAEGTGARDGEKTTAERVIVMSEETGLRSITLRIPTTAPHQHHDTTTTASTHNNNNNNNNNNTSNYNQAQHHSAPPTYTTLTISPATLLLVKLLTTFYPDGRPWSSSAAHDNPHTNAVDNDTAPKPISPPFLRRLPSTPATIARNRRVWLAMTLGWAWALQAHLAAHPAPAAPQSLRRNHGGGNHHHRGASSSGSKSPFPDVADKVPYLCEEDDMFLSDNTEDDDDDDDDRDEAEWQARLEDLSELDIDDADVLAALARVNQAAAAVMEGVGGHSHSHSRSDSGQRRASLVPSDGDDDEQEARKEAE